MCFESVNIPTFIFYPTLLRTNNTAFLRVIYDRLINEQVKQDRHDNVLIII